MLRKTQTQVVNYHIWPRRILFVIKCQSLTFFMIAMPSIFLHEELKHKTDLFAYKMSFVEISNYSVLYFTAYSFWLFLYLVFFRRTFRFFSWWFKMFFTFLMSWMAIPLMFLPLMSAQMYEWYYGFFATLILMGIHSALALFKEAIYDFSADFLINWNVRGFIISSLGIVVSIAWKNSHTDVCVAMIVLIYTVTFTIATGRSMGSDEFYIMEIDDNEHIFIIINLYNFVTIYSHLILAFCKIRCILAPHRVDSSQLATLDG